MYPAGLTSLSFEKVALYLVAALLDDKIQSAESLKVSSDMGVLVFKTMDLIQDRGKMPLLTVGFEGELDQSSWVFEYFGHISPVKFHSVSIAKNNFPFVKYTFSEVSKNYVKFETVYDENAEGHLFDIKLLCGSLFLTRSCTALPKACEESLSKYFSKMKVVSRYKWKMESYFIDGDKIVETWSCVAQSESDNTRRVVATLCNGIIDHIDIS